MAPVESAPNSRLLQSWPNILGFVFAFVMFVSLRILEDTTQKVGLVLAWLCYVGMIVGRLRGRFAADQNGKNVALTLVGPADVFLLVGAALCEWSVLGTKPPAIALPAGVLCMIAGVAMVLALELAFAPMRATGFLDARRASSAARTATTLVCAMGACAALTYGVDKLDIRRDYSFAAPSAPSAATISILDAASCPALESKDGAPSATAGRPELFLFFERGSPALGVVRDYFDQLQRAGARVTTMDSAIDPALAKQIKVSKNGTVGFRCGGKTDTWGVGDEREDAEKKVGRMDEEVRTRLAKLTKESANVYVTVGHGERNTEDLSKPGERTSAKNLKKLIEAVNAKVKKLGLAEGLSKEVPNDAALVIVPGPTTPFLPEEANTLAKYVKGGGSLLLMIDPRVGDQADVVASLDPLLAAMNVKIGEHEVMNDKAFVENTHSAADHAFIYSTSFGSHKSVKTLSSARGKAALLFLNATTVEKRDPKLDEKTGPKVSMIARTPPGSYVDANANRAWDEKDEPKNTLDLAAAIETPKVGEGDKAKEGRAIVVGDSDVLADMLITQDANQVFGYEAMLWLLRDDDKLSAEGIKPDEDVAIRHTRDEDTAWFYVTVFAGPVLCIGGGLVFVNMKRRRKKSATTPPAATTTGGAA